MRIPGYCRVCHKIKTVHVARPTPGGVQIGICAGCEDAEREDRR